VKSILKLPKNIPVKLKGEFKKDSTNNFIKFYKFSNSTFPVKYYPPQKDVDCGYFELYNQKYTIKGKFKEYKKFGCDLDEYSFKIFKITLSKKTYFIITSIAWTSGTGTRNVFCNLFDVTNKEKPIYYPLWSMYGSNLCFGDYNNDGNLDFLEIRYDPSSKNNDIFRATFTTIDGTNFKRIEDKYIVFKREYRDKDLPLIVALENKWLQ